MKSTGEELIQELENLRVALSTLSDRLDKSGVQRTAGLLDEMGRSCPYYKKSMDIFVRKDYLEIRDMVERAHKLFCIVEGKKP